MNLRRWLIPIAVLMIVAFVLVQRFRESHELREREEAREEPVIAPSRVAAAEDGIVVRLDTADVRGMGIAVEPLKPARAAPPVTLNARVIADSARIAMVRAPFAGRLDVADGATWPELGTRLQAGTPLAQIADAKPVLVPRSGVVTMVGARPGEMVQAGQPLIAITDVSQPLIRVAWSDGAPATPPGTVRTQDIERKHAPVAARLVGQAPEVDPLTQRPAWYYRMERGWPGVAVGLPLIVEVPGGRQVGSGAVAVPPSAAVQWEGLVWAYVERRPGEFSRVRVTTDVPLAQGWAVAQGFEPGDLVVTRGAEQLLSEEFRARVTVGEEVGE